MVSIKVDLQRREQLRRLHTVTHIINHAARQVLGNHIWQNGSNLKPQEGSLDLTHYETPSRDQIFEIEKISNEVIFENKKVSIEELERTQAEKKYGFSLYQGGAIPMKKLRVIHVDDSDIEACGGLHMHSSGGIGLVKITEVLKIQDGVIRFKYVVREFALDSIYNTEKILDDSSKFLGVQKEKLPASVEKFFKEWKEQKKEITKLKQKLKSLQVDTILESSKVEFPLDEEFNMSDLIEIYNLVKSNKKSIRMFTDKITLITPNLDEKTEFKKKIDKKEYIIYIK